MTRKKVEAVIQDMCTCAGCGEPTEGEYSLCPMCRNVSRQAPELLRAFESIDVSAIIPEELKDDQD